MQKSNLKVALFSTLSYIAFYILVFSLLETALIYPPIHSYNIGPPFFWFLIMSPFYSVLVFVGFLIFGFVKSKTSREDLLAFKKRIYPYIVILSMVSFLFTLVGLWDGYRNLNLPEIPELIARLSQYPILIGVVVFPVVINNLLMDKLKIRQEKLTLILIGLAVISYLIWSKMTSVWMIGL